MWGSLDASMPESWPEDPAAKAWKDREAAAALQAQEAVKTRSWGDVWGDIKKMGTGSAPFSVPASEFGSLSPVAPNDDPSVVAAARVRASVKPVSGRAEGPLTRGVEKVLPTVGEAVLSGVTAPGDAMSGKLPMYGPEGQTSPEAVRRAFDTASLAGGGAVGGAASKAVPAGAIMAADAAKSGAPIAAAAHAQPFYSALDQGVSAAKMTRAPGAQWEATLRNAGVKPEELDYRGVTPLLRERAGQPITKEELTAHLQANPPPEIKPVDRKVPKWDELTPENQYDINDMWRNEYTRTYGSPREFYEDVSLRNVDDLPASVAEANKLAQYGQYQLPGAEGTYRERLLTMPPEEPRFGLFRGEERLAPEMDFGAAREARGYARDNLGIAPDSGAASVRQVNEVPASYKSNHWDEPNVLVHRRSTDREFPVPHTPEEQAAMARRAEIEPQLEQLRAEQGDVARTIRETAQPLDRARYDQIGEDIKSGKISRQEAMRLLEQPFEHPELKPHQDRLQQLRAQEDQLRAQMPEEVAPKNIRSLHAEEIQSDWHQAGRKQGYGTGLKPGWRYAKMEDGGIAVYGPDNPNPYGIGANPAEAERVAKHFGGMQTGGVPDAPFKKTWHELAAKDMLHEAAQGDYPRISWTAGGSQPTNPKNLGGATPEQAAKADAGLQGFYDKMLPDYLNKIGKKYGVKVERSSLPDKGGMTGEKAMDRMGIPKEEQPAFWKKINEDPHGPGGREEFMKAARDKGHDVFYMDVPEPMKKDILQKGFAMFEDASAAGIPTAALARAGGQNVEGPAAAGAGRGVGGGARSVEEAQAAAARYAGAVKPLEGLPQKPLTVGGEPYVPGPIGSVHDVAKSYMESAGRPYVRQDRYHPIDEAKSTSIAKAFDEMPHAPDDPRVKASYNAMINETRDQYDAAVKSGVKFEPIPPGMADPYAETPRLAAKDVQENNHLWYFPTDQGFGSGAGGSAIDLSKHPMMQKSGRKDIHGNDMLNNDLFRVVHDYFGHLKEGNGFRAAGEDNAWRTHAQMYSDEARPAMTTETRGQNSWVNYGPHGEKNRTASAGDTTYADQKVGLLPDWVWKDELPPAAPAIAQGRSRFIDERGMAIPSPAYTKEAQSINKEIAAGPKGEGPLDLSLQKQTPGVEQQPLERYVPPRGIPARMQEAMANPDVAAGLEESMKKGAGVADWYHTEPIRQEFIKTLGKTQGETAFKQYMDLVAATSPRSDVPTNIRNASYYYAGGDPAKQNPYPYGHVAQNLHKQNVGTVSSEAGWNPMQNPKPASFAENLRGNLEPVTVDTHAFRNIAMRTKDPRFLETSYTQKIEKGREPGPDSLVAKYGEVKTDNKGQKIVTFRPQQLVKEGKITIEEAQKIPSFWASKPKDTEYAAAEALYRQAGNKVGMRPADAQAAAWSGGGEMTGLGTVGTHTFNELMNERIMFTAKMRGEKPDKVLRDFIAKGKPLLSDTSVGAFGSLDGGRFDPEGSGYDYKTAKKEGLGPDATGHWPSRGPKSGLILKGHGHPTFNLTEEGEKKAGYTIKRRADGRFYSTKEP